MHAGLRCELQSYRNDCTRETSTVNDVLVWHCELVMFVQHFMKCKTSSSCVGGFTVSKCGNHAVVCVTIDNLLKGAATQALANGNLGLGLPELEGIHIPTEKNWEFNSASSMEAHNFYVNQRL